MYRQIAADVSRKLRKQGFTPGAPYLDKLIGVYEDMRKRGAPQVNSLIQRMKYIRPGFSIRRDTVIDALVIYNEIRMGSAEKTECLYHLGGGVYADKLPGVSIYDD